MLYSVPQLRLLILLALTLLVGLGVREWRAGFPDAALRLERRTFVIGLCAVLVLVAALVALQLARRPSCVGRVVIVAGPGGTKLECVCERGRIGACFDPGR